MESKMAHNALALIGVATGIVVGFLAWSYVAPVVQSTVVANMAKTA